MNNVRSGLYQLEVEVTTKCNLKCSHCYLGSSGDYDIQESLMYKIIDQASDLTISDLIFSGGEPTLNNKIFEYVSYIKKKHYDFNIGLLTNGTTITEAELYRFDIFDFIQFSLDFPTEKKQYHFNNFDLIINLAQKLKSRNIYVSFLSTLDSDNYLQIDDLINNVLPYDIQIGFNILCFQGNAKNMQRSQFTDREYRYILRKLTELQELHNKDKKIINVGNPLQVLVDKNKQNKAINSVKDIIGGCTAGITTLTIDPHGNVYPCPFLRVSIDNINDKKLEDIWYKNEILAKLRNRNNILGKCHSCSYINICGGCRSSAYLNSGDIFGEDPLCFRGRLKNE